MRTCGATKKPWWRRVLCGSLGITGCTPLGMHFEWRWHVGILIWLSGNAVSSKTLRVLCVVFLYWGIICNFTHSAARVFRDPDKSLWVSPGNRLRLLVVGWVCHAVIVQQMETAAIKITFFFFLNASSVLPISSWATVNHWYENGFEWACKAPKYREGVLLTKPRNPIQCLGWTHAQQREALWRQLWKWLLPSNNKLRK